MAKKPGSKGNSQRQDEILQVRAVIDPTTVNKDTREVEVVFATDTPILMRDWDGNFYEVLSTKNNAVRLERLNAGAPLLDNHNRWEGVEGVMGRVVKAWTADGKCRAIVKFSKRADVEPVWQDVLDGILTGISCGYRVYEYEIVEREGEIPTYTATDWEGFEISLAPVPADYGASVRSADKSTLNKAVIKGRSNSNTMPPEVTNPAAAPAAAPAVTTAQVEAARTEGIASERKRVTEIRAAVRAAKLSDEFAETLIAADHSVDKSRELIIAEFAKVDPAAGAGSAQRAAVTADETDKKRSAMSLALEHRANPAAVEAGKEIGKNPFRGMDLSRMAEQSLQDAGVKTVGMSKSDIARAAMNLGERSAGMLSSSDFPIILGNTVNRVLLSEYALAARTFTEWAKRGTAKDFRTMTKARLGDFSNFAQVNEGSEYEYGSVGEGSEAYKVVKYGKIIAITWETLVNDDLDAFSRLPQKIANAAARKQSDIVYAILSANAAMSDGVALFHANHGNLGTPGAIGIDSLGEARKLMRNQKGLGGFDYLNLTPRKLVVGPNYESLALQYTSAAYLPTTQAQVNPFKNLDTVVEPRITGNVWYIMASAQEIDTVEFSFLEGQGELFTETRYGFNVDGVEIKARMVFGAKAIDWKGMVKNAGA